MYEPLAGLMGCHVGLGDMACALVRQLCRLWPGRLAALLCYVGLALLWQP
jgi:hypothetical protein